MSEDEEGPGGHGDALSATDAFQLLAHETRLTAMEVLWAADGPLAFSEIADRGDIGDTGNFNYHFGKLVGHFVRKKGEAYELTRSGRQAMTAVLAGDVTDRPSFEAVTLDQRCPYCESRIELHHDADVLRVLCTSCSGTFEGERRDVPGTPNPPGTITTFAFPAAGLRERDPEEVLDAALLRLTSRYTDMTTGVCPDCAGPVERRASVCGDHDPDGVCSNCTSRFVGLSHTKCQICGNTHSGLLALVALADSTVREFFYEKGYDPVEVSWQFTLAFLGADERVHATDPIDYEAAWTLGGETLRVRIEAPGTVESVEREDA